MPRGCTPWVREHIVAPTATATANQAPAQPIRQGTWLAAEITVGATVHSRTPAERSLTHAVSLVHLCDNGSEKNVKNNWNDTQTFLSTTMNADIGPLASSTTFGFHWLIFSSTITAPWTRFGSEKFYSITSQLKIYSFTLQNGNNHVALLSNELDKIAMSTQRSQIVAPRRTYRIRDFIANSSLQVI